MRNRLAPVGFGVIVLATLGAFFLIQTFKTAPPLLWAPLRPVPAAISPVGGRVCTSRSGKPLNYAETKLRLALSHSDNSVGVYIVSAANAGGGTVDTLTSGTPMVAAPGPAHPVQTQRDSRVFTWNGRLAGGQPAPAGTYYFRIVLAQQGRSIDLSQAPVEVFRQPPRPRILDVRVAGTGKSARQRTTAHAASASSAGPAVLTPPRGSVRITFTRAAYRRVWIDIYRTDVIGRPQLAVRLPVTDLHRSATTWNGEIGGQPAPAGTYLVGITAQNPACDQASWPAKLPPAPGSTPHAGVTIRYLSVTPPLTAASSGARATVAVASPDAGFAWHLRREGARRVLAHGSGPAASTVIRPRMPRRRAGLYTLTVRAGLERAVVPLVASQAGAKAAHAPLLVVLPLLSWMGDTPVDDTGSGLPATLAAGDPAVLRRPLVDGPPRGLASDAGLLAYLSSQHLHYQLTTDVALAEGRGPSLTGRRGVILADGERFLPQSLVGALQHFVRAGGSVLTLGTGSFTGVSHITGYPAAPVASAPRPTPVDPFGARRGSITPTGGQLITELSDALGLFTGTIAFSGFASYQPIQPPAGTTVSSAGVAGAAPAIVAFHFGAGTVIEVGLPNFGASLARNADSQALLANALRVLTARG